MSDTGFPFNRHTRAITYSFRERLYFRLFGHNPKSVTTKRLVAYDLDRQDAVLAAYRRAAS